jgi:DNA-binding LacI/PurR family transcriptional regulator
MTTEQLQSFFEEQGFSVFLSEQDGNQRAELESWTDGGVDMIIWLNPFTKEEFVSYVNDFDVDDVITNERQNKDYCSNFTIRQSVDDFEAYYEVLKKVVELIEKL